MVSLATAHQKRVTGKTRKPNLELFFITYIFGMVFQSLAREIIDASPGIEIRFMWTAINRMIDRTINRLREAVDMDEFMIITEVFVTEVMEIASRNAIRNKRDIICLKDVKAALDILDTQLSRWIKKARKEGLNLSEEAGQQVKLKAGVGVLDWIEDTG